MARCNHCTIARIDDDENVMYSVNADDGFIFDDGSFTQYAETYRDAQEIAKTETMSINAFKELRPNDYIALFGEN